MRVRFLAQPDPPLTETEQATIAALLEIYYRMNHLMMATGARANQAGGSLAQAEPYAIAETQKFAARAFPHLAIEISSAPW